MDQHQINPFVVVEIAISLIYLEDVISAKIIMFKIADFRFATNQLIQLLLGYFSIVSIPPLPICSVFILAVFVIFLHANLLSGCFVRK